MYGVQNLKLHSATRVPTCPTRLTGLDETVYETGCSQKAAVISNQSKFDVDLEGFREK